MQAKLKEKKLACKMRAKGYSFSEISSKLSISKSSASTWTRNIFLSKVAKNRLLQRRKYGQEKSKNTIRAQTKARLEEATSYAKSMLHNVVLNDTQVRIICALLYWCEGEKSLNDGVLSFTNSDPLLATAFVNLLRKGFDIKESKFRVCIHLHDYHNKDNQLRFWSRTIRIPQKQFMKPYCKPHTGKQKRKGYAGCVSIRYYDSHIARRVHAVAREFLKQQGPIG